MTYLKTSPQQPPESLLHMIWEQQLLTSKHLFTTQNEALTILDPGQLNHNDGPDFNFGKIILSGVTWIGDIEIHWNSGDWFKHSHHTDEHYNNVVLHVVFKFDKAIHTQDHRDIPTLVLSPIINPQFLKQYEYLMEQLAPIPCRKVPLRLTLNELEHWLKKLCFQRLNQKKEVFLKALKEQQFHWGKVFLHSTITYWGGKDNKHGFTSLSEQLTYRIILSHQHNVIDLEALLFGVAGFLHQPSKEAYPNILKQRFIFLKHKHNLNEVNPQIWKFRQIRPANFPTIRIAQLAMAIHKGKLSFSAVLKTLVDSNLTHQFLFVQPSPFWKNHYRFNRKSNPKDKPYGKVASTNIMINVWVPVFHLFGSFTQKLYLQEHVIRLMLALPHEDNKITREWKKLGFLLKNSVHSQGYIELYQHFCLHKKCVNCEIGKSILTKS